MSRKLLVAILLSNASIFLALVSIQSKNIKIAFCDVGQGDASVIQYRQTQIIIDGGPNKNVLGCLGKVMPFWDREIEMVILTHPHSDHYLGITEIFKRYKVKKIVIGELKSSNKSYQVLENQVGGVSLDVVKSGTKRNYGDGLISLDIENRSELLILLKYKDFESLYTADLELKKIDALPKADVIKVPHHGSNNGLDESSLLKISPKVAVISVGEKNRYGHPSKEVLDLLDKYKIPYFRTDRDSDVVITTDGTNFWKD